MNSLNSLLSTLNNDEIIKRFKQLEQVINNDQTLLNILKTFKDIQKQYVQESHYNKVSREVQDAYSSMQKKLLEYPLISEYLELIEDVNNILQNITYMIENSL